MPGPTIGTFPHNPTPPDDAAAWLQNADGNMRTTMGDFRAMFAAAAPPLDLSPVVDQLGALLADPTGQAIAAQILAVLRAGIMVQPSGNSIKVELPPAALPLPVQVQNVPLIKLDSSSSVTIGGSTAPLPTLGYGSQAAARGLLYVATAGPTPILAAGAPMAMLVNPANSKKLLYLDSYLFTSGLDAYLTRGRLATIPTSGLGTAVPVALNSLGSASTPAGKLYFAPTVSGVAAEWGTHVKSGTPITVQVDGRVAIPAGTAMVFSAQALGAILGTGLLVQGALSLAWAEVPSA